MATTAYTAYFVAYLLADDGDVNATANLLRSRL